MSNSFRFFTGLTLAIFALLSFSGCATMGSGNYYEVSVSSLAASSILPGQTYVLVPADPAVSPNDLEFSEFAKMAERMLALNGLHRQPIEQKSSVDFIVRLGYGISNPQQKFDTVSTPQFGTSGYQYMSSGYFAPVYGYTGYADETVVRTEYRRIAVLDAVRPDPTDANKTTPVWKTSITSEGSSGDLRLIFPVMLTAAQTYVGRDTGSMQSVTLYESNPTISIIRGYLPMPLESAPLLSDIITSAVPSTSPLPAPTPEATPVPAAVP